MQGCLHSQIGGSLKAAWAAQQTQRPRQWVLPHQASPSRGEGISPQQPTFSSLTPSERAIGSSSLQAGISSIATPSQLNAALQKGGLSSVKGLGVGIGSGKLLASSPPWASTASTSRSQLPAGGIGSLTRKARTYAQGPRGGAAKDSPEKHTKSGMTKARSGGSKKTSSSSVSRSKAAASMLATSEAAAAASQRAVPQSKWMALLRLVMGLAGRVLHAVALTFCLVAILLLRPRVAVSRDSTQGGAAAQQPITATQATVQQLASKGHALTGAAARGSKAASSTSASTAGTEAGTSSSSGSWFRPGRSSHQQQNSIIGSSPRPSVPPLASMSLAMAYGRPSSLIPQPSFTQAARSNAVADVAAADANEGHVEAAQGGEGAPAAAAAAPAVLSGTAVFAAQEASVAAIFKSVQASVVNISGARAAGTFSSLDVTRAPPATASGFIWDDKGHVVTAYSAVRGAAEVKVTLADAATFTAKLVGWDAAKDVAVLRLSLPKARLKELVPIKLGAVWGPGGVMLGMPVWGLGNASGLDHTITQGIVSGLGRELPGGGPYPLKGLLQTDAACSHQAGGVVVNAQGRLVGMVVAPTQPGGRAAGHGLGYALPVDMLRGLVQQVLVAGRPTRPTMGVTLAPPQVLAAQGVEGVLLLEVPPGSPAATAGLRHTHRDIFGDVILGDVIVGIEGMPVRHAGDLYAALDARKAGDRVRVDILRDGKATSLTLVLGERGQAGALEE